MELSEIDKTKIRNACHEISTTLLWDNKSLMVDDFKVEIDELINSTEQLFNIAVGYFEHFKDLGCTVELLLRVIEYISEVHAIPPLRGNFMWFDYTLCALLELACPNYLVDSKDFDFIEVDLKKRVEKKI